MEKKGRRIGVYICHCGTNIAGTVDVEAVTEFAQNLPGVVVARNYKYMCSDPGQDLIKKDIKELGINRVVEASCSPRMHEPTFRRALQEADLNPYFLEMSNIREHCSWVHKDGGAATEKAKVLVNAAVRKVYYHEPLEAKKVPVTPNVLVVGGGIAGIEAALKIANGAIKVYLVEKEPSIGGNMIKLDKTFPTLDCSACILTPKMSEVGSHPNIELLTYSEVEDVSGYSGNFKVKIRKKARYVDEAKCIGCGECFKACPVEVKSEFEEKLANRKAIYIPFPQAVPNKAVIDKREERPCKAACMDACPVHTNVPGYIKLISEGKFEEAYRLIRSTNPLPAVCGRVCYASCEDACNREQLDEPIAIRELKRVASDQVDVDGLEVPQIEKKNKKVAIIGSGPAGLAAANDLALEGNEVTIFEALPETGGLLRYGIPEYRLPKEVLRKEINYIQRLGVEMKTRVRIGKDISLAEIKEKYQAVFIATGAHKGRKLELEGEEIPGVMDGINFLRSVNLGEETKLGEKVAVIGGGNTAIDCARTAKRLGGKEIKIVYRRSREEMPASKEELKAVGEEGIEIEFLMSPLRFFSENGKLSGMECVRMELGEPDSSGRRRPIPVRGTEFIMPVDTVIAALGQAPETEFVQELGLSLGKRGEIEVDFGICATNVEGIFAGGDVVTGPASVIEAIAAGKRAAHSINRYLRGEELGLEEERKPEKLSEEEVKSLKEHFPAQERMKVKERTVEERAKDFREVSLGLSPQEAIEEALRCLAGQIEGCIGCRECEKYCEVKAINHEMKDEIVEAEVGSIVIATGYQQFDPSVISQYGYGRYENVITGLEFERMVNASGPTGGQILLKDNQEPKKVGIIHCVGSRDKNYHEYCSRVCCMYALKFSHLLREHIPDVEVYQFYIDLRCFGKGYEEFYDRVLEEGTNFVNFIKGKPAEITDVAETSGEEGKLIIQVEDILIGKQRRIPVDMVILCSALEPRSDADKLIRSFRIGKSADGFFMERHPKLDPVATANDGIYVAGCCQGPKDIPDSVAQASAAATRALASISKGEEETEAVIATIDEKICSGCKTCISLCPYEAISFDEEKGVAVVNEAVCKGCGLCAAGCPSGSIAAKHFTTEELMSQIEGVLV